MKSQTYISESTRFYAWSVTAELQIGEFLMKHGDIELAVATLGARLSVHSC